MFLYARTKATIRRRQKGFEYEETKLTYQKIEWTWNDGGITATDSWAACI
jgi:type VI protein secretion system component Hcp